MSAPGGLPGGSGVGLPGGSSWGSGMRRAMHADRLRGLLLYFPVLLGAVASLVPFVWMLVTSLGDGGAFYRMPPQFIPESVHLENYAHVMGSVPFARYFLNSVLVTLAVTVGTLVTTVFAAFAFVHFEFRGKQLLFVLLVATMMVPSEVLLTANFVTMTQLKLINTIHALYLPWIASAYSIFLLRQYFIGIPRELYAAARIDGCGEWSYLLRIMIPYSAPALTSIALLRIINSWNEFLWPLLMVSLPEQRTLPVGLATFMTEAGAQYHYLMAYSAMVIVPVIIIYLFLQKRFIVSFSRGGIKG